MDPTPPSPAPPPAGTPLSWRLAILAGVVALTALAYSVRDMIGPRGQAALGIPCFIGLAAAFSADLRRVNWRTVGSGFALQLLFALLILKIDLVYQLFVAAGHMVERFLAFSNEGAKFVFGPHAEPTKPPPSGLSLVGGGLVPAGHALAFPQRPFVFAFTALPTVIFVSSFFSILYFLGILQLIVRAFARVMTYVMGTSGAETLSATANVFMGQTEAPLIVKPYVPRMTRSELLALMVGGMATIAGGVMAVYIQMGANPVAILATSVMAAPAGLYLTKLLLPETEEPETRGRVKTAEERLHSNVIDAAAGGASDGMLLALNIAAMLIAFLALIALVNYLLRQVHPELSLEAIFGTLFAPVALLIGVDWSDVPKVGELLGIKLVANEFVAYATLTGSLQPGMVNGISERSYALATYALTGFANFGSIGIQLGGIGAMAPGRRGDLARLGGKALLGGFLATLINASIAGLLM